MFASLRPYFVIAVTASLAMALVAGCAGPDKDPTGQPLDSVQAALSPAECQARYAEEGFPMVYQDSPLDCSGLCTKSFQEFCTSLGPTGKTREGVGVRWCTPANPCVDMGGGNITGGSPAPCACTLPNLCPEGCNTVDGGPTCACASGKTCDAAGKCIAPSCEAGTPQYPPPKKFSTPQLEVGYDVPDPAATWACTQLVAIPFAGPFLFTPNGGIGAHGRLEVAWTDQWAATCRHETTNKFGAGVTVNICGLGIDGSMSTDDTKGEQFCLNCGPPTTCGNSVACTTETGTSTKQVTITKTFSLTSKGVSCETSAPSGPRWLNWLKKNIDVSVTAGGGWRGTKTTNATTSGPAVNCDPSCKDCKTVNDSNTVFVQLGGRATLSTPTWFGISGSAYISLTGRAGVGLTSLDSCTMSCSGTTASASVTLRLGAGFGAFGLSGSASVGCTCSWSKTWSDCPNGNNQEVPNGCRWADVTDPQ